MPAETEIPPELLAALQLSLVPGVGPRTWQTLVQRFGTAAGVFAAAPDQWREVDGVGPKLARALATGCDSTAARAVWQRCRDLGIQLRMPSEAEYPVSLRKIIDPPGVLYVRGEIQPRDQLAIAIVGSRRCTVYGVRQAERLAGALARAGLTIVSGLARGIDAAAHRGALQAGGRTLAVLATGVATIYPPEHAELALQIREYGALVSEMPLDQEVIPGVFPQRNRIISGLSLGVLVVEATRTSGTLHTVRHALEQGREVFAIPGPIDSLASAGCHDLIRDGATLVRHADDVLEALGPLPEPVIVSAGSVGETGGERMTGDGVVDEVATATVRDPRELTLSALEREILELVPGSPTHVDTVLAGTPLEASRVLATLTVLEMKRFVRRLPGGAICRR